MSLTGDRLREIVSELITRPGHEKVRALVYSLLVDGLGAPSSKVLFEEPVPEVRGRLDALLGRTIFEFKRNLQYERRDAEEKLARYLQQREKETGERFLGIATDGAAFVPYELYDGRLRRLEAYQPSKEDPEGLVAWLGAALTVRDDLAPDPEVVRRELGRGSLAYEVARGRLERAWRRVSDLSEVRLKRQLWSDLLQRVYGVSVDDDNLFFQHTFLTIVAKTMATRVLGIPIPSPGDLLSGGPFQDAGITGAVESDFFDWVLSDIEGADLVRRIAAQVTRFRLDDVRHDVLKGLYESLIDPEQRHDLGEYYTPDWLAARICAHVIDRPLEQRVLDPACGSGTFLFHAIRLFLEAATDAGLPNRDAVARCCQQVIGVDVHPVAVLIARVTYLLALGEERLRDRPQIAIPVYLGDSLQWNTRGFLAEREVLIEVPEGPLLHFPASIARDPANFDAVIQTMLDLSDREAPGESFDAWLQRQVGVGEHERGILVETYEHLRELRRSRRNHIWGYVARNLSRPLWLSSEEQRADVVLGNPPWLSYRFMSPEMKRRFRDECERRGLWSGGRVATHQDLSAYFFARCVELYLRPSGIIAFIMPYAALNRKQFEGFRTGWFGRQRRRSSEVFATVRFMDAWAFDETVQPLLPLPSCVLFAKPGEPGPLPANILAFSGALPRRDATPEEAEEVLNVRRVPWPAAPELAGGSPYRGAFRQGATMVPRLLCTVELARVGRLGRNPAAPLVVSRRSSQEKRPWKELAPLQGNIEAMFLRPLYLGESIAPFRLLDPVLAIVPWDQGTGELLDAAGAEAAGYIHLAGWLRRAESLWRTHGHGRMSFREQLDYYGKLSAQMPPAPIRVLYAASGTLPAAAVLRDADAVVEHALYWMPAETEDEAYYLAAILNSEPARGRVADLQARGQWGARHFDKLMLELPIPRFDPRDRLHRELARAGRRAEQVAAAVTIPQGCHFVRARRLIREALEEEGVSGRIASLVGRLLG